MMHVPTDAETLFSAITAYITDDAVSSRAAPCANPYGDGQTGPRVAKLFDETDFAEHALPQKKLTLDP